MRMAKIVLILSGFVIALAGCSSTPFAKVEAPAIASVPVKPVEAPVAKPAPAAPPQVAAKAIPPYLDPNSALSTKRSVYFDFDNFSVKPQFESLLSLHGKYLAANPTVAIKVEGNADERGGSEYNLALGQKRAEAVANALKVYGVKSSQIEATSWGKEKPKASGHDETSWAENRRADLVYPRQ
jgi:peptidoglycan-associated lipoprotein